MITETTGGAMAGVATLDRIVLDLLRRISCHHHAATGKYFLQPWHQTAGAILKCHRDKFGLLEVCRAKENGTDPYDLFMAQAAEVPASTDGLILLPYFMGAASPEFNPDTKGVLFGLSLRYGRGHIVRAIVESIAYMLKRNLKILEGLGVEVCEVRSTGVAGRSCLWNQIKADLLQKPILTVHTEETAALGAAMLASLDTDTFASLDEPVESKVSVKARFTPSEANREIYNQQYKKYVKLYSCLEKLF